LGPTEYVLPEDGDRIQSPKLCVLKNKQDGVLDKDKMMDNVQKHNICTYFCSHAYSNMRCYWKVPSFTQNLMQTHCSILPSIADEMKH
jgi:hypothetical protein